MKIFRDITAQKCYVISKFYYKVQPEPQLFTICGLILIWLKILHTPCELLAYPQLRIAALQHRKIKFWIYGNLPFDNYFKIVAGSTANISEELQF